MNRELDSKAQNYSSNGEFSKDTNFLTKSFKLFGFLWTNWTHKKQRHSPLLFKQWRRPSYECNKLIMLEKMLPRNNMFKLCVSTDDNMLFISINFNPTCRFWASILQSNSLIHQKLSPPQTTLHGAPEITPC